MSDDFTRQLGDPQEGRFRAALQYRQDSTCPTTVGARLRPPRIAGWQNLGRADGNLVKPDVLSGKWIAH